MVLGDDTHPFFLPFQQSAVYGRAAVACGAKAQWVDLGIGFALAVDRGPFRLISRGPVWTEAAGASVRRTALRGMARRFGVTLATPEAALVGVGLIPLVTPVHHAVWDLCPDPPGNLRTRMAGKWRNGLALAERAGLAPRATDCAVLGPLLRAEGLQRSMRRYRALPAAFTLALPGSALRLWEWRKDGQLQAAMAFVRHGRSASYHLGWASPVARLAGVHRLMLVRAAEALQTEGVCWLDLGSVNTDAAPGLARFKLGSGAALRPLGATLLVLP